MTILHFNDVYNVEPRAKEPRDATRCHESIIWCTASRDRLATPGVDSFCRIFSVGSRTVSFTLDLRPLCSWTGALAQLGWTVRNCHGPTSEPNSPHGSSTGAGRWYCTFCDADQGAQGGIPLRMNKIPSASGSCWNLTNLFWLHLDQFFLGTKNIDLLPRGLNSGICVGNFSREIYYKHICSPGLHVKPGMDPQQMTLEEDFMLLELAISSLCWISVVSRFKRSWSVSFTLAGRQNQ